VERKIASYYPMLSDSMKLMNSNFHFMCDCWVLILKFFCRTPLGPLDNISPVFAIIVASGLSRFATAHEVAAIVASYLVQTG
jgi:hypothetical protein